MTREAAIAHSAEVAGCVDIPVAADLENGFGPTAEDCAVTIRDAARCGLCGGSIEDSTGDHRAPVFELSQAVDRILASVEAAKAAPQGFVLTARAEAFLYGDADLNEVIARLRAFEEAGAEILFAPGLPDLDAVRAVCSSVSAPVNVLIHGKLAKCSREELADAGAGRISLGGALAFDAYAAMVETARTIKESGCFDALKTRAPARQEIGWFLRN